jgi:hypothetical protein
MKLIWASISVLALLLGAVGCGERGIDWKAPENLLLSERTTETEEGVKLEYESLVDAPAQAVYDALADIEHYPDFVPGVSYVQVLTLDDKSKTVQIAQQVISRQTKRQGEVDLQVANATSGTYLRAADQTIISKLVPDALGIMPEISTQIPALVGSQFNPKMQAAGIPLNYPEAFGIFYDWKTGKQMNLSALLLDNSSILLQANKPKNSG